MSDGFTRDMLDRTIMSFSLRQPKQSIPTTLYVVGIGHDECTNGSSVFTAAPSATGFRTGKVAAAVV
jgi:hypothetical protein